MSRNSANVRAVEEVPQTHPETDLQDMDCSDLNAGNHDTSDVQLSGSTTDGSSASQTSGAFYI